MKLHLLAAAAALTLASTAFAHPGHGTTPASDGGKPHVHFGTPKTPASTPRALPIGDKRIVTPAPNAHKKGVARQAVRHTR